MSDTKTKNSAKMAKVSDAAAKKNDTATRKMGLAMKAGETLTKTGGTTMKPEEKKMDRRTRKTVNALRTAFLELLRQKPADKITVTEITKLADVDRKTFYLHYDSIDALADELLREEVERMSKVVNEVTIHESGTFDLLELFRVLSAELVLEFGEKADVLVHTDMERVIAHLEPLFVNAIVENDSLQLAEHLGPHLDIFVSFFCAGLLAMYRRWVDTNSELPLEDFSAMASAVVAGGVASLIPASKKYVAADGA